MPRLLFEKTGSAVWISHLDLMRLFQRAFKRAGLPLTHTQGFNPRPSVSIALPLSVGIESACELLDFELDGESLSGEIIRDKLNKSLLPGVKIIDVYGNGKKIRELAFLRCGITLEYDNGVPAGTVDAIRSLFSEPSLCVVRKTKSGMKEQDIIPMIRSLEVEQMGERTISIFAAVCCQNPTLNPVQLVQAIKENLHELAPDHATYRRLEIYDKEEKIFR